MISAVITVYKSWALAQQCLTHLNKHASGLVGEIIIVDDCPEDPVPGNIAADESIVLIKHVHNTGYVRSVNEGFAKASGHIVILLDSDAFVATDLSVLWDHFEKDPHLGLAGFKTLDANGNESGGCGPEPDFWFLLVGQQIDKVLKKLVPSLSSRKQVMHSHAFAVRKAMLEEIGGFDEDRFAFYEADNDFSMRINRHAWWTLKHLSDFSLFHDGGSSPILTSKRVIHIYESRWALLKKYSLLPASWLIKLLSSARLSIEWLVIALFGRFKYATPVWRDKLYSRSYILSKIFNW